MTTEEQRSKLHVKINSDKCVAMQDRLETSDRVLDYKSSME
jgi:hypothetical protein